MSQDKIYKQQDSCLIEQTERRYDVLPLLKAESIFEHSLNHYCLAKTLNIAHCRHANKSALTSLEKGLRASRDMAMSYRLK